MIRFLLFEQMTYIFMLLLPLFSSIWKISALCVLLRSFTLKPTNNNHSTYETRLLCDDWRVCSLSSRTLFWMFWLVLGECDYWRRGARGTHTWRMWRERLTIALDDDWLFFDTPNIVLDVLIGGGERSLLTYEEHWWHTPLVRNFMFFVDKLFFSS